MAIERVWIPGADGFTGQHLLPILQTAGYQCDTTDIEITDADAVKSHINSTQPDAVINLAAISFVPDATSAEIYAVNSFGPEYILQACAQSDKTRRVILPSTAHVYGPTTQQIISETSQLQPISHYGYSKWVMEQIASRYRDRLDITLTRPFNYTGQGQPDKFLVPKLVSHYRHRKPEMTLGNLDVWRDFSDVRWVCEVYAALLKARDLDVVNICSQTLISIRDMLDILERLTGHEIAISQDPRFMRANEIKKQCGDNQKLINALPNLSPPPPIEETLEWMLER